MWKWLWVGTIVVDCVCYGVYHLTVVCIYGWNSKENLCFFNVLQALKDLWSWRNMSTWNIVDACLAIYKIAKSTSSDYCIKLHFCINWYTTVIFMCIPVSDWILYFWLNSMLFYGKGHVKLCLTYDGSLSKNVNLWNISRTLSNVISWPIVW